MKALGFVRCCGDTGQTLCKKTFSIDNCYIGDKESIGNYSVSQWWSHPAQEIKCTHVQSYERLLNACTQKSIEEISITFFTLCVFPAVERRSLTIALQVGYLERLLILSQLANLVNVSFTPGGSSYRSWLLSLTCYYSYYISSFKVSGTVCILIQPDTVTLFQRLSFEAKECAGRLHYC